MQAFVSNRYKHVCLCPHVRERALHSLNLFSQNSSHRNIRKSFEFVSRFNLWVVDRDVISNNEPISCKNSMCGSVRNIYICIWPDRLLQCGCNIHSNGFKTFLAIQARVSWFFYALKNVMMAAAKSLTF